MPDSKAFPVRERVTVYIPAASFVPVRFTPEPLVKVFPFATSAGVASPRRAVAFAYGIYPSVCVVFAK